MKYIHFIILLCLSILLFFAFLGLNSILDSGSINPISVINNRVKDADEVKEEKVSIFMVGDSLIHSAVYADKDSDGNDRFEDMISNFRYIVRNHDLAFYNQESILGGSELGLSTYPAFNSPYEVGDAFRHLGFNLVSLANNHTLDRGEQAIKNSRSYWNKYGNNVLVAGSSTSYEERDYIRIMEKNGIKYALLAYTESTNGIRVPYGKDYLVNVYNEEQVKKDIESIRDKVDLLMVSMHWGEEYNFNVTERQRNIAKALSDLGVNIIIGHHPHVVEEIDIVGNTLVVYSLGNFISAQRGIEKLTGLMVSCDAVKKNDKIKIENIKAGLTYTYSDESKGYREKFKVYPYSMLTEEILPNYEEHYSNFMSIVNKNQLDVKGWDFNGNIK